MAKKQRPVSRPTPTASPLPEKDKNVEEDGNDVEEVEPSLKTPSTSNGESMSSESNLPPPPTNSKSKSKKRPNKNNNGSLTNPKRTKKEKEKEKEKEGTDAAVVASSDDGKADSRPRFQRLWSFDDEITILKGMLDFISKYGSDPSKSIDDFHNFIKKSLHVQASTFQLKEKIRKLKIKFDKNGETPTFSKPHDSDIFELSKKIWGNAAGGSNGAVEKAKSDGNAPKNPNVKVVDLEKDAEMDTDEEATETTSYLTRVFQLYGLDKDVVKKGIKLFGASERVEFEGLWKEVHSTELEFSVRRVELVAKYARLILEAYKSSNH